jgi:hypothetical protein
MDADVTVLLEAIENAFDIKFDTAELDDDSRIDDVCEAIRARFGDRTSDRCFASIVFWRLRQAVIEVLGAPRNSITPSTGVEYLIPAVLRRRVWRALSEAAGLKFPGLEYGHGLGVAIFWASFVVPPILLAIAGRSGWWIAASVIAMPITVSLLFWLLRPFAIAMPAHSQTLGNTARIVVGLNYGRLAREFGPSRDSELIAALRYVIADVTGISPHVLMAENPRLIDLVLANDGLRVQL